MPDALTEADEMDQNAGEKGRGHSNPDDPPRRRANKKRGHGNYKNDRPPVLGMVGRTSKQIRLRVVADSGRQQLEPLVTQFTCADATVYTDEWKAYEHLPETGRARKSVCHTPGKREWARDDDGDGIREVHCNTMEGIWVGLRNFLRPFRGVSKHYLAGYVAVFEWAHNLRRLTVDLVQALMMPCTLKPS